MKISSTLLLLIAALSSCPCMAQGSLTTVRVADSLVVSVRRVCFDSTKKTVCHSDASPDLAYDFTWQYPYYRLKDKKWETGTELQLEFSRLPASGYLYIFTLDADNTPVARPPIHIADMHTLPLLYPEPLKGIVLNTAGKQYIGLWYSKDSLSNVGKLMMGIEFTTGPIVKRNNRQLGKLLLLPDYGWHFYTNKFGFMLDPALHELPEKFVLPVIIEISISGNNRRSNKKLNNR